jgi:hypothetical protein
MIKPMLAASLLPPRIEHTDANILATLKKCRTPVLVTEKKDGIRNLKLNILASRTLKAIPNKSIQSRGIRLPYGLDTELFSSELSYEQIESIVMSEAHRDSDLIQFHIIDIFQKDHCYAQRIDEVVKLIPEDWDDVVLPEPILAESPAEIMDLFLKFEKAGKEGICFRTPNSPYIQKNTIDNRSTLKEQYLVKLCRFHFSEAIIVGFYEQMANANRQKRNALGAMDRSSHGINKIGKNTLGGVHVMDCTTGQHFDIGIGFSDKLRKEIWDNQKNYVGKVVTYKYKGGIKLLPRSPIYQHFRKVV